jgi:hypothetical protein
MYVTIDDYDARSRNQFCSVTGLPKGKDETRVFRLADIDFEGCFDIGEQAVKEMAGDLGMITREVYQTLLEGADTLTEDIAVLEDDVVVLLAENRRLKQENFELLSEIFEMQTVPEPDEEE